MQRPEGCGSQESGVPGVSYIGSYIVSCVEAFQMAKKYEVDMTKGAIMPLIIKFAVPVMLSSFLQLLYNAADMVVLGRFAHGEMGTLAQSAVGSTGALVNLMVNLFMGLSVGAGIVCSQMYGADRHKELRDTLHTSMALSAVSGLVMGAVGFFSARTLLTWMDTPAEVLDLASLYVKIYSVGTPANLIFNFGAAILRSVGDTRRPMYILLTTGLVNVILNVILVTQFGMTVDGVAWATVAAQVLSAAWVVALMVRSQGVAKMDWKALRFHKRPMLDVLRYGLPTGIQGMLFCLSNVIIQSAVNSLQAIVMAGNGVAGNIEAFIHCIMVSVYQACLTATAQNCGAKDARRVKSILLISLVLVAAIGLIGGNLVVLFGDKLARLYNDDPLVIAAACDRLKVICGFYCICGMMDVLAGSLRGMGLSLGPMVVSVATACGLRIVWIYTVFTAWPTLYALLLSYPVSWGLASVIHAGCFVVAWRKRKRLWATV